MFNCAGNLYIDVESFSSFTNISLSSPTNANGTLNTAGFGYSPGNPGDIVVVRLIYQWPIIAAGIGFCAATADNRKPARNASHLHTSLITTFEVDPAIAG